MFAWKQIHHESCRNPRVESRSATRRMVASAPALDRPTRQVDAGASPTLGVSVSGSVRAAPGSAVRAPGSDEAGGRPRRREGCTGR